MFEEVRGWFGRISVSIVAFFRRALWTYITSRVLVHPCSDFTRINFGYVSVELSLRSGWSALYFPSERGGNSRVLIRIWPEISRFSDDRCGSQLALFLVPGMFLVWILVNKVIVNIFLQLQESKNAFLIRIWTKSSSPSKHDSRSVWHWISNPMIKLNASVCRMTSWHIFNSSGIDSGIEFLSRICQKYSYHP